NGTVPRKNAAGVWISDETRNKKKLEELKLSEIQAACKGEITLHHTATPMKLMGIARKKLMARLSDQVKFWSDKEIFTYLVSGQRPSKTPSGLWPNCPIRQNMIAREWSKEELV